MVDPTARNDDLPELEGSLPDLPDLSWEDFERASELARGDVGSGENF